MIYLKARVKISQKICKPFLFFSEQKIIVIKNIQLLDKETDDVFKKWIQYFEKPNPDVFVIIEQLEVLPKNSPTSELLMKHAYIEKIDDMKKRGVS